MIWEIALYLCIGGVFAEVLIRSYEERPSNDPAVVRITAYLLLLLAWPSFLLYVLAILYGKIKNRP